MTKKRYECSECGFIFPSELSELIEGRIQVYCEKCGTPFTIKGVVFKPLTPSKIESDIDNPKTEVVRKPKSQKVPRKDWPEELRGNYKFSDNDKKTLGNIILGFNQITSIPIFIVSFVIIGWLFFDIGFAILTIIGTNSLDFASIQPYLFNFVSRGLFGFGCLFIAYHDYNYISKKVKDKQFNEILIDAFCWGILGCIYFGIGVILLLKGVAILIYNLLERKNFAYNLKNSLNNFSAKAGIIIVILNISFFLYNVMKIQVGTTSILSIILIDGTFVKFGLFHILAISILTIIGIIILIIDKTQKEKIKSKNKIEFGDAIPIIIIGIIGVAGLAIGIFILFKGALLFIMAIWQPKRYPEPMKEVAQKIPGDKKEEPKAEEPQNVEIRAPPLEAPPQEIQLTKQEEKMIKQHVKKTEKLKKELEKKPTPEKEFELKLHESLLPVSDEKDKALIKEYFTKIFSVLSKDVKNQIEKLKISKKEKKELLKELAFLTKDEQVKYVEAIINTYQEIPKKLIDKIKKLPNVKPENFDKIIEQLKYLDSDEQIKFVQFLEENA